ncbi:acetyltransferase [Brumimicrobium mesophilum]|uniref:acetyltransferase n=1 Tax=Brumimicrobium mesophilum TaxID=392717 RepID=UPI000D141461|nr:acetyltransferase [Brumimicrobium mesophilum]
MNSQNKIAFIGYSGHAYVCIETAFQMVYDILGYFDLEKVKRNPYDLDYLGKEEEFEKYNAALFCSIGNNHTREKVFNIISAKKENAFTSLIHPRAIVSKSATIGTNTLISARAVVNALAVIETGCIINSGAIIEHESVVKAFAHIAPGAVLSGNVTIGERSFIGAAAVIKQGVTIGNDVIVGAGAVVLEDIPDNYTIVGNPAKKLEKRQYA